MKPPPFEYAAPGSLEEVLHLLAEHGDEAKIIAGGQSLMPMLAIRLARPAMLVDVNGVTSLSGIEDRGDVVAIRATTREREAERSQVLAERVPVLAEAIPFIGHVSIRNRGTVGGSLAHADASAELPAVALITEADIVAQSRHAQRVVPAEEFFVGHFSTTLADDECLVEVQIPTTPAHTGWSFQEVARRHGDFALVGVAAMVSLNDKVIKAARICLIGVADRPVRPRDVEAALVGASVSQETFAAAGVDAVKDLEPASDMQATSAYRRHVATLTVRRALTVAAERAGGTK